MVAMQITKDATGLISQEDQLDAFVISTCTILARKYNIQADIDPITRQCNFTGGTDKEQHQLSIDISDTLQRYCV